MIRRPPRSTLFPSTTLSRSEERARIAATPEAGVLGPCELVEGGAQDHAARHVAPRLIPGEEPEVERRSEEHTSELQSRQYLVCRLLLEKKKNIEQKTIEFLY